MGKSKASAALLLAALIVQRILFQLSEKKYAWFPFASDMEISFGFLSKLIDTAYGYLPWAFILFFFWGYGGDLIGGYGKLIAIRSHQRVRLCLDRQMRIAAALLGIVAVQTALFSAANPQWEPLETKVWVQALALYYLGILNLVLLQFLLELKIRTEYANLIANLFAAVALLIGNRSIPADRYGIVTIGLFPNLAFASRNGVIESQYVLFEKNVSLAGSLGVLTALTVLSLIAIRKKDLF